MSPERVLVADDDGAMRTLMANHLQRRGYLVESACDGLEAMQALKADTTFSVLVTDLTMPRMGGLELLREARKLDPWLEVIVATATDDVDTAISAMREYGAYEYLIKPLGNINELSGAVGRAADYRKLRLEREELQARLLADAKRLQALIASTGDAIVSADAHGKLVVANPAAARLLDREDLVGADALSSLPKSLATLVANWQAVAADKPAVVEVPWRAESTVMVTLSPMPGANGKSDGWVMAVRDITHLKRLDDLKMRLFSEAANKIQVPLAQAFAVLADLTASAGAGNDRQTQSLYRLTKLLGRIQTWIDELLTQARIEAGIGIQPEVIDLAKLAQDWVQTVSEKVGKVKAPNLSLTVGEGIPRVYADRDLMRRLFQQLVGQVVMSAKAGPGSTVDLSVRYDEGQVWIEVAAAGPAGKKKSGTLRASKTNPLASQMRSENGGLELAMVRAIATQMGGQVWLRGDRSTGNTIAVCLPPVDTSP